MYRQIEPGASDEKLNLPALVCKSCSNLVIQCYEFKTKCEENEQILLSLSESDFLAQSPPTFEEVKDEVSDDDDDGFNNSEDVNSSDQDKESNDEVTFTCDICDKTVSTQTCLNRHRKTHFLDAKFQCDKCNLKFNYKTTLKKHLKVIHANGKGTDSIKCDLCDETFPTHRYLKRHQRTHIKTPFSCNICNQKFRQETWLKKHLVDKHKIEPANHPNRCKFCNITFPNHKLLRRHLQTHSLDLDYKCDKCTATYKHESSLKKHIEYNHGKDRPKIKCDICNQTFFRIKEHIKVKHPNSEQLKLTCPEPDCNETFVYKSFLDKHILKVHRALPANRINKLCPLCGKLLYTKEGYRYHMLKHNDEKPYECKVCQMKFRSPFNLTRHMRGHTDERPYNCKYCDRAFRTNGVLQGHERIHTGEKPYQCGICNKNFRQKITLTLHMKVHQLYTE